MQHCSTKTVPRADRLAYWQSLHRERLPALSVTPASRGPFDAEYVARELGPLMVRETSSAPARVEVTADSTSAAARQFVLLMPVETALDVCHNDMSCTLAPGDFVLLDTGTTSVVAFTAFAHTLSIAIPPSALASHLPDAELVAGIPIRGQHGLGQITGSLLRTTARELEHGLPPDSGYRLANSLLEVIATSYLTAEIIGRHGITQAQWRRLRAKRVIDGHLQDPRLSPAFVADAIHVSARYLRMLFEQEGEHPSRYIQRRRLEKCAEQLRSGAASRLTLTDVAFAHGFSSMAHFSRVFRERFGITPRQYRANRSAEMVPDADTV